MRVRTSLRLHYLPALPISAFTFIFLTITILLSVLTDPVAAQDIDEQGIETSTEWTKDSTFKDTVLKITNTYRKQHNATALKWNDTLEEEAREWSERCFWGHSGGPTGENLAIGYQNASAAVIAWGHERVDYDFRKGSFSKKTGHFTQLVWKSTNSLGCARSFCSNPSNIKSNAKGWYLVCNYYPPGNVLGVFRQNVQEQVDEAEDEKPEDSGDGDGDGDGDGGDDDDDPRVPDEGEEGCMLGAICSGSPARGRVGGKGLGVVVWILLWGCVWMGS